MHWGSWQTSRIYIPLWMAAFISYCCLNHFTCCSSFLSSNSLTLQLTWSAHKDCSLMIHYILFLQALLQHIQLSASPCPAVLITIAIYCGWWINYMFWNKWTQLKTVVLFWEKVHFKLNPGWRYRVLISFLYLHCLFALRLLAFQLSKIGRFWPFCRKKTCRGKNICCNNDNE